MIKNIYILEESSKRIYDAVSEYCMVERVNEEYFRASMRQEGWKHRPAVIKMRMAMSRLREAIHIFGVGTILYIFGLTN